MKSRKRRPPSTTSERKGATTRGRLRSLGPKDSAAAAVRGGATTDKAEAGGENIRRVK